MCIGEIQDTLSQGVIPVVTSSYEELLDQLHPDVVVDAILAKKIWELLDSMRPLLLV